MERLKNEISKKYETRNSFTTESQSFINKTNGELISSSTNPMNKIKQKEAITKLKLFHNELEHNYVILLKNLSRKILKPRDLLKRPDAETFSKKIK